MELGDEVVAGESTVDRHVGAILRVLRMRDRAFGCGA
jgi:hypothetical protein